MGLLRLWSRSLGLPRQKRPLYSVFPTAMVWLTPLWLVKYKRPFPFQDPQEAILPFYVEIKYKFQKSGIPCRTIQPNPNVSRAASRPPYPHVCYRCLWHVTDCIFLFPILQWKLIQQTGVIIAAPDHAAHRMSHDLDTCPAFSGPFCWTVIVHTAACLVKKTLNLYSVSAKICIPEHRDTLGSRSHTLLVCCSNACLDMFSII